MGGGNDADDELGVNKHDEMSDRLPGVCSWWWSWSFHSKFVVDSRFIPRKRGGKTEKPKKEKQFEFYYAFYSSRLVAV